MVASAGDLSVDIRGIAYDSRQVEPGFLFVAIKGFVTDGHFYINDAVTRGAAAVLLQDATAAPPGVPWVQVCDTRSGLAAVSARFYNYPARVLHLAGVTGTNGKTTTTYLLHSIYRHGGHKVGLIGTISNYIGDKKLPVERTTPEALDLQRLLRQICDAGCRKAVMEVSSHALALNRVDVRDFNSVIFTNLTQDHLDFHKDMEDYFNAKARLFKDMNPKGTAVINADDRYGQKLVRLGRGRVVTYGVRQTADVKGYNLQVKAEGVVFDVASQWGNFTLDLRLTGLFNVYNALAAAAAGLSEGYSPDEIQEALAGVTGVPGRFERVDCGQEFTVIIDYAHTPDGLDNVLLAAQGIARNKVIAVFGCGGDRDKTKRPLMGKIAANRADFIVVTSDNPRSENPMDIIADIVSGFDGPGAGKNYTVVPDRREAIRFAFHRAQPGDIIVIAGKGHEDYQIIGNTRLSFDDRKVASEILKEMGYDKDR